MANVSLGGQRTPTCFQTPAYPIPHSPPLPPRRTGSVTPQVSTAKVCAVYIGPIGKSELVDALNSQTSQQNRAHGGVVGLICCPRLEWSGITVCNCQSNTDADDVHNLLSQR